MRILPLLPLVIPRLAWHPPVLWPERMPPALVVAGFPAAERGQPEAVVSAMNRSGVRDIQFDYPQIRVEPCPLCEEIRDFGGTRRFGGSGGLPAIAARRRPRMRSRQATWRPRLLITIRSRDPRSDRLCEGLSRSRLAACDPPEQPCHFELRREPAVAHGAQAASRSSAPIARPRARRGCARRASSRASARGGSPG